MDLDEFNALTTDEQCAVIKAAMEQRPDLMEYMRQVRDGEDVGNWRDDG